MATTKPDWIKVKPAELEKIVIELAKSGESPAKIGLILRDKHGIPKAKILGKKISQILKEANIPIKEEKTTILSQIENIKVHLTKNKHDHTSARAMTKKLWAVHKLEKSSN